MTFGLFNKRALYDAEAVNPDVVKTKLPRDQNSILEGAREGGDIDAGDERRDVCLQLRDVSDAAPAVRETAVFDAVGVVLGQMESQRCVTNVEKSRWLEGCGRRLAALVVSEALGYPGTA